jgi:hypothetical protein
MNRLSFKAALRRGIYLLFGLFLFQSGISQNNASVLDFVIKAGSSFTFDLQSTTTPSPYIDLDFDWGNLSQPVEGNNGEYEITYTAPNDFEGDFSFLIQYTGTTFFPFVTSYSKYTEIRLSVRRSIIDPVDDIILLSEVGTINIQPSVNDIFSDGPVKLTHIAHVQFGTAEIIDPMTLHYTSPDDFNGRDQINYIIEDTLGNYGNGVIYLVSEQQTTTSDTVYLTVSSEFNQYIFLPKKDMNLVSHNGGHGNVESINSMAFNFTPIPGKVGRDVLVFEDGTGYRRTVIISLKDNSPDSDMIKDDYFFTAVNRPITFNVSENDLIDGGAIVYHSPDLTNLGNGIFSYQPQEGFNGFKEFVYKVNTGSQILTGNITLKIDNYYPLPVEYEFNTTAGKPLVLQYDMPIDGYSFHILSPPSFGDLEYFSGGSNVNVDCGTINLSSILYTPIEGYTGIDEFDLEYCIDGDQCKVIKVSVQVDPYNGEDCTCVEGCVWPGDTNQDGIVNFSDILSIGYYMGETGNSREITSTDWSNESSPEWLQHQVNGVNMKHVDTDGNGMITHLDTAAVINNFGKYHSIIPSSVNVIKKAPIVLIPRSIEVDSGDLMVIDIALGNSNNPVLDIHGLTFQLNIDPSIVDSASFECHFHDNSWISDGFGVMQDFIQPEEGVLNAVLTRTNGLPQSGDGIIGTTTFIVEDHLEGFRIKDGATRLPFDIDVSDILAFDSYGQQFTLPAATAQVYLKLDGGSAADSNIDPEIAIEKSKLQNKLYVYPNPARNVLNIHLNGSQNVRSVRMYDLLGRTVYVETNLNTDRLVINLDQMQESIYLLEISDGLEIITQKVKVSK